MSYADFLEELRDAGLGVREFIGMNPNSSRRDQEMGGDYRRIMSRVERVRKKTAAAPVEAVSSVAGKQVPERMRGARKEDHADRRRVSEATVSTRCVVGNEADG